MSTASSFFQRINSDYPDRPVAAPRNNALATYLEQQFRDMGLRTQSHSLTAEVWSPGESMLTLGDHHGAVHPSPWSKAFDGTAPLRVIGSFEELHAMDFRGCILILHGEITQEPLMPKNFPFYFPDEHRRIIERLECEAPAAIVAVTGKHPFCGLDPFPLFEDGALAIPSACTGDTSIPERARKLATAQLRIDSHSIAREGRQVMARYNDAAAKRVLLCAHMDTKHATPGALDNSAGVAVLLHMASRLHSLPDDIGVDIVPFNGEEHYQVPGQLLYLDLLTNEARDVQLAMNIDAVGHTGSRNAFSFYNIDDARIARLRAQFSPQSMEGEPWISGDHSIFAFRGVPSIALSSSDLLSAVMALTHTTEDTGQHVDTALLDLAAEDALRLIAAYFSTT